MSKTVTLKPVNSEELATFKQELQRAFCAPYVAHFGANPPKPFPADSDLDGAFGAPGSEIYHVVASDQQIGGAQILVSDTGRNELGFFFIKPEFQNQGFGYAAWEAIEASHPETKVWWLITPYPEKRNINFYVNKCGFKIVEFFNPTGHPDTHPLADSATDLLFPDDAGCLFRFEKEMPAR